MNNYLINTLQLEYSMFDQIPMDTTKMLASDSLELAQEMAGNGIPDLLFAMAMPLFILLLFSYLKNTVAVSESEINKYEFLSEMAIDFLSIFISFIIGRYVLLSSTSMVLIKSFVVILGMAVGVVALCHIRRVVLKKCSASDGNLKNANWLVALEFGIDCLCFVLIAIFFK